MYDELDGRECEPSGLDNGPTGPAARIEPGLAPGNLGVTAMLAARMRTYLARDEGYSRWPYRDSRGHMTIGIGHLLIADQPHTGITDEAVESIFQDDLAKAAAIYNRVAWLDSLSEARQGVVLNMTFNLGVEGVLRFRKMFEALHDQEWDRAADEMLDSEWARQVGKRAERLAEQMRTDQWV